MQHSLVAVQSFMVICLSCFYCYGKNGDAEQLAVGVTGKGDNYKQWMAIMHVNSISDLN